MTAWFKRTRPETPPVVQDLTETGEEAPAALRERLQVELWPQCVCRKPAVRVVLIHNLDHCEDGPMPTFVCNECETDVYRFIDDTLACVHRFERWACKTCGGPVTHPHDLIEDVVKL